MNKTSVYLPPRLKGALAARAVATGRSEAEVIRAALETEVWAVERARRWAGSAPAAQPRHRASG